MKTIRTFLAIVLALLAVFPSLAAGTVLILDYHSFLGVKSTLDYRVSDFAAQLDRIKALGYTFVPLEKAMAGGLVGDKNIAITIDDGNHSVMAAVEEALRPRGIPVELFIYPAAIGRAKTVLTPEQLVTLQSEGCGIGAHGYTHQLMTPRAWLRNRKQVLREASMPMTALARITGKAPSIFAYPYGVAAPGARDAVRAAGYAWAFLANEKIRFIDPTDPALDHWAVPRTIVYHWNRQAIFRLLEARAGP
ncbi:MAG: polysaccharide deacetylase family protein [Spirochaetota bacterium]